MNSLVIVNALVAVGFLQLVPSFAFPPLGGGGREIPRPPVMPNGPDQHHVTWAPGDGKPFTGHDDHSAEELGKGVTFVPPRGDHAGFYGQRPRDGPHPPSQNVTLAPRQRGTDKSIDNSAEDVTRSPNKQSPIQPAAGNGFQRRHKRGFRPNGPGPKDGPHPPRNDVTLAPRQRGTDKSIDNSAEDVTRSPSNQQHTFQPEAEKPDHGFQRRHRRDVRPNGPAHSQDGQHPPRNDVTFAPRQRGTDKSIDNSAEDITRSPPNKLNHLVTEARGDNGKGRREGPRNH